MPVSKYKYLSKLVKKILVCELVIQLGIILNKESSLVQNLAKKYSKKGGWTRNIFLEKKVKKEEKSNYFNQMNQYTLEI